MIEYPSIPLSVGQTFQDFQAYVFGKLDGCHVRVEWTRKTGWGKWGTRERRFDLSDALFAGAITAFTREVAESLTKVITGQRFRRLAGEGWDRIIAYGEYFGDQSFAGVHVPGDPTMRVRVFDLAVSRGKTMHLLGPQTFIKLVVEAGVPTAPYLGQYHWTRGFVDQIWRGELATPFEGVVGKAGNPYVEIMAKAKTQAWHDRVLQVHGIELGTKIVTS
jgi:RNA ligase